MIYNNNIPIKNKNILKINKSKAKRFRKSTSFKFPLYKSIDNPFHESTQLVKTQSEILNGNNRYSMNNFLLAKKIIPKKLKLFKSEKKSNASTINLPGLANLNFLNNKFFNLKSNSFYKSRNNQNSDNNLKDFEINAKGSLLYFDSSIKSLYENSRLLKNNKIYQEERIKKKNELNFDYDENNYYFKHNSFSGNNPNILKKKVMFVKNIFDYIYPKIIINRMKFIDKTKINEINIKVDNLNKKFQNKYYINRYKSPEENSAFSKYNLKGAVHDEGIKQKGNFIKLKKILINGRAMIQLAKNYDYINN